MDRLAEVGASLTVRMLRVVERGDHEETPQDPAKATKAPMLAKSDGRVDWSRSAQELQCHIRAMHPWPGATTSYTSAARARAVPVTLLRSTVGPAEEPEDRDRSPGEVIAVQTGGIVVRTGRGRLVLEALKPAGKRALEAGEFRNGYRTAPGDLFGP